jgi:predicted dehydrogenase
MDKIRIGVIGLKFGQHHVRTLANMEDAHLVAMADNAPDVPGGLETYAAHYGATAYRDGLEMLDRQPLDAVSLCVSPVYREKLIESAASKGIALLVEKPWAADVEQARHLAALCRRYDATVMVGFSFRFLPAIVRLRDLMDGALGAGWLLNGEYVFDWLPPPGFWLWQPRNGGGFFNENSCHLFDSVCYLLGDPVSVMAEAASFKGSPSEEIASITLRFAGGALAALTVGCLGAGAKHDYPRIDLVTANGQAHLIGRDHIWERLTWALRGGSETQTLTAPPEMLGQTRYTRAIQHFFDCLRSGQKPSATIEDGIRSVVLAQAVYESARTGRKVQVSL